MSEEVRLTIYLQDNNPDTSAERYDIINGDQAEIAFNHTSPDEMSPLHSH